MESAGLHLFRREYGDRTDHYTATVPSGARHDGTDRWLQRTYIRRSLWNIRHHGSEDNRRVR